MTPTLVMTPTPPDPLCAPCQSVDAFLNGIGRHIGQWMMAPHVVPVAAVHVHVAPHLAIAAAPTIATGLAVPTALWLRGHHKDFAMRLGGLDPRVRREMHRWNTMIGKVFPPKPGFMEEHPMVMKAIGGRHTASGTTLLIHLDARGSTEGLQAPNAIAAISASIGCPVKVESIYMRPHRCHANLHRRDTLAAVTPWPWLDRETTDFLGPIPVAVDLNGSTVAVDLREKNALLGGEPGGGKSMSLHEYIAAAALDVRVHIHIFAGKQGTDFRVWEPICDTFVTDDEDDADKLVPALSAIKARMDRTYKSFGNGTHAINWRTAQRVDLVVIDEPGAFPPVLWKYELAFNARGRAAGVMSVLATQRPSSKIMDTDLRALYQIRHGHRLEDAGMLMTLGDNYRGYSAKDFGPDRPGECWLVPNDRTPIHCRSYFLTDSDLANLAERATRLRSIDAASNGEMANDYPRNDPQPAQDPGPRPVLPKLELVPSTPPQPELPTVRLTGSAPAEKLRTLLQAIADLGPEVPGPALREALTVGSDVVSVLGNRLLKAGLVCNARKAPPGAPSGGRRDPLAWSITPAGKEALSQTEQSRNSPVALPKEVAR